jgi:hypothetical protein
LYFVEEIIMLNKAFALSFVVGATTCGILALPVRADMATVQQSTHTTVITGSGNGVANRTTQVNHTRHVGSDDGSSTGTVQISDTYTDIYGNRNVVVNEQTQVNVQERINRSQRPDYRGRGRGRQRISVDQD